MLAELKKACEKKHHARGELLLSMLSLAWWQTHVLLHRELIFRSQEEFEEAACQTCRDLGWREPE